MIEISLIKDKTHYQQQQLDMMEKIFTRNFITHESPELETSFNPDLPEIRIHIRLIQGVLPELLFKALGEDLCDSITNKDFLNAFIHPSSQETPSLIFHFVGDFRSFEFKITSKDEKNLEEGSQKVIQKLLGLLNREELPPQSTDRRSFRYENGDWTEV
ncbi:MAG: hypothetical protein HYW01_09440 [Deltaproteobacteria bacterium]|nr:hypothetical protein [Deltaproteobacteria bacterium]